MCRSVGSIGKESVVVSGYSDVAIPDTSLSNARMDAVRAWGAGRQRQSIFNGQGKVTVAAGRRQS
jgi:hypothetical protein